MFNCTCGALNSPRIRRKGVISIFQLELLLEKEVDFGIFFQVQWARWIVDRRSANVSVTRMDPLSMNNIERIPSELWIIYFFRCVNKGILHCILLTEWQLLTQSEYDKDTAVADQPHSEYKSISIDYTATRRVLEFYIFKNCIKIDSQYRSFSINSVRLATLIQKQKSDSSV